MKAPSWRPLLRRHHTNALNVVMFLVAGTWLAFQLLLPATEQPPILNIALQATFGAWLTNLAYEQRNREERTEARVSDAERRVGELEVSDTKTTGRVEDLETADSEKGERLEGLESMAQAVHPDEAAQEGVSPQTRHEKTAEE